MKITFFATFTPLAATVAAAAGLGLSGIATAHHDSGHDFYSEYLRYQSHLGQVAPIDGPAPGNPAASDPPPIAVEALSLRHAFPHDVSMRITQGLEGVAPQIIERDDATHVAVLRFTIQPGVVFPWHTHPGTVLVNIVEGDFVFLLADDCVRREYSAGMGLVDPGDSVHTAYNPSAEGETVVLGIMIGVPAEGGLTIPVDDAEGARLDEQCGIDRDAIAHGDH